MQISDQAKKTGEVDAAKAEAIFDEEFKHFLSANPHFAWRNEEFISILKSMCKMFFTKGVSTGAAIAAEILLLDREGDL